jgi:shikimate dehydrogenase
MFVNASSVGLGDAAARVPIAADSLRPDLIVADVVFNPPKTWLIRTAEEHGCRTIDGLGMLVNQAVICSQIWTGRQPDAGVMRDALEEFLEI